MHVARHDIDIVTAAGGGATGYSPAITGRIVGVHYIKDATTPLASTADFTVTVEDTGEALLSQTNVAATFNLHPRVPTHDVNGAAALYAAAGQGVLDALHVAKQRIKWVVAQGGATKVGKLIIVVS